MKKPIVWNKENIITNGIWIIIGEIPHPSMFPVQKGVKSPVSMSHTLQFVKREAHYTKSWENTTLAEIEDKSMYNETLNEIIFSNHGGVFDLEHIEDGFYVAGIQPNDTVKIGVNDDKNMLIIKYKKLLLAIMGMEE